jgi:hypothetical protein
MAGVEPGIIIIRGNNDDSRNNYKKKVVEAYPNYDLKLHYRAG